MTLRKKALENTVGKGENAGKQHFLLFPQCFQKSSVSGSLKVVSGKGLKLKVELSESVYDINSLPHNPDF